MDLDVDQELLALADDSQSSSKKRSSSSKAGKRRKPVDDSEEDGDAMDIESESGSGDDDEEAGRSSNPYPLEGLYKNESDRKQIMKMPELEREEILAARTAERDKLNESRQLDEFIKRAKGPNDDIQGPAQSSKRAHQTTGLTSTKKTKLAELSKKRSEKQSRQSGKSTSASHRRDSDDSGSDADSTDSEDEAEKRARKKEREAITLEDLERVRISRGTLAEMCKTPHFEEYVVGGYVRYNIGMNTSNNQPVYRICEVVGVEEKDKLYQFDNGTKDYRRLILKIGTSEQAYYMNQISNSNFMESEWQWWYARLREESISLPTKSRLSKTKALWADISKRKITDVELSEMLRKKKEKDPEERLQGLKHDLTRRRAEHTMAIKRLDPDSADLLAMQIRTIESDIASLTSSYSFSSSGAGASSGGGGSGPATNEDLLQKLNEKNRKAQLDAIKKNDQEVRERRRLAAKAGASGEIALGSKAKARLLGGLNGSSQTSFSSSTGSGTVSPGSQSLETLDIFSLGEPKQRYRPEVAIIQSLILDLGDF